MDSSSFFSTGFCVSFGCLPDKLSCVIVSSWVTARQERSHARSHGRNADYMKVIASANWQNVVEETQCLWRNTTLNRSHTNSQSCHLERRGGTRLRVSSSQSKDRLLPQHCAHTPLDCGRTQGPSTSLVKTELGKADRP